MKQWITYKMPPEEKYFNYYQLKQTTLSTKAFLARN